MFETKNDKKKFEMFRDFDDIKKVHLDLYLHQISKFCGNLEVLKIDAVSLVRKVKRKILITALVKNNFMIARTAAFLNIKRTTFSQMLDTYDINVPKIKRRFYLENKRKSEREIIR